MAGTGISRGVKVSQCARQFPDKRNRGQVRRKISDAPPRSWQANWGRYKERKPYQIPLRRSKMADLLEVATDSSIGSGQKGQVMGRQLRNGLTFSVG